MITAEKYISLITNEHQDKPKFEATLRIWVDVYVHLKNLLAKMPADFDIDIAIGAQLDILGIWIGQSRKISLPIEDVYFTWDDKVITGWDNGLWKGIGDPDDFIIDLPDDLYRRLLKSKIASNNWTGDTEGMYNIIDQVFTTSPPILITDNQDKTYTITIPSGQISNLELALLTEGYIVIKQAGMRVIYEVV